MILLIANILRPVLLEFGAELVKRVGSGTPVILSGLIESDVESVSPALFGFIGPQAESGAREKRVARGDLGFYFMKMKRLPSSALTQEAIGFPFFLFV